MQTPKAQTIDAEQSSGEVETIDLSDPHYMDKAFDTYAGIQARGPVAKVVFTAGQNAEGGGGGAFDFLGKESHFVTHYDEVVAALMDDRLGVDPRRTMTEEQRKKMPPVPEELRPFQRSLLSADPPDHTRLRKLVQPSFTGAAMEALRPRIHQIADDLLDAAEREAEARGERAPDRQMDLIKAFAYPLPVTVISELLGIPQEDRARVRTYTEDLLTGNRRRGQPLDEKGRAKMREFHAYLRDLFDRRRATPTDDLISRLVHAEEDGDKLDSDELLSMVMILYLAGHVTTVNLVGNAVVALMRHPDQLAKLRAEPELAKGVVEETLRYWGPVDFIGRRTARQDLEIGGCPIAKGDPVVVSLAAADRDPKRFPDPEAFDITRPDAGRHVAFGKGIHVCLGAPLARVEGQVALAVLFQRFPQLQTAVPPDELSWSGNFLRGFGKVPVRF
ncbi:MAG TPA: cytochrome P450 [Myxococcales bacterium]|nr:cytochrome P450 [Myxococcales bacterium]